MFAVPGWSVSADKLKPEVAREEKGQSTESKGKKRKRPAKDVQVTSENFADLWERVIEDKGAFPAKNQADKSSAQERKKARKRRKTKDGAEVSDKPAVPSVAVDSSAQVKDKGAQKEKRKKKGKTHGDAAAESLPEKVTDKGDERPRKPKNSEKQPKPPKKAGEPAVDTQKEQAPGLTKPKNHESKAPKLTPLQASMREKLVSARFRHLNETLYTRPSAEAFRLFEDDPGMFEDYHAGFRHQVDVWPENPVDGYIRDIVSRGRVKAFFGKKHAGHPPATQQQQQQQQQQQPLPRTDGTATIADLGCGDARLAAALQPHLHKLHLRVLSYDLHSPSPLVTRADIARLPLRDGSVDVAVFCLALMGTNWLDFVEEAYRVLRWKGELWVAEIKSRFGPSAGAKGAAAGKKTPGKPVAHSVGARKKNMLAVAKGGKGDVATNDDAADLAVEVDGAEDRRRETDVSAFVEALRRRGFVLNGGDGGGGDSGAAKGAIDLSNKMFVKMSFVKAAPAVRGKGVQTKMKWPGSGADPAAAKMKTSWPAGNEVEEDEDAREKAILKPCVYKLR